MQCASDDIAKLIYQALIDEKSNNTDPLIVVQTRTFTKSPSSSAKSLVAKSSMPVWQGNKGSISGKRKAYQNLLHD
ncbi:hypothetical protein E4T56_gene344 [Termitomyces sp. T112]|nr:hypothetical protein E4T56_gene344 [Termitomyces sp. T112]